MVGGDPMDNLRPVEKNIVLFWLMMWYISIYSRLLRRCLPVSWMFGKNGIRLVFESRRVAQRLPRQPGRQNRAHRKLRPNVALSVRGASVTIRMNHG
jgi:hypothetical protein